MRSFEFTTKPLDAIGVEVDCDLSQPLGRERQAALVDLLYEHGLLVFRGQSMSDADHDRVLGHFGNILTEEGGHREIAVDGNLGSCRLLYHSDLSFTPEPFRILSLYGLDIESGSGTSTLFASGTKVLSALPPALDARVRTLDAVTALPPSQTDRRVNYNVPAFLPQVTRPAVIPHPQTGRPVLFISEMQTARLDGLSPAESEGLLQELFAYLYAPENTYEHVWREGDLVIWDNVALQHGRADQAATVRRRLRRVAIADKTFFQLCPQFTSDDPRILAWGSGADLMLD